MQAMFFSHGGTAKKDDDGGDKEAAAAEGATSDRAPENDEGRQKRAQSGGEGVAAPDADADADADAGSPSERHEVDVDVDVDVDGNGAGVGENDHGEGCDGDDHDDHDDVEDEDDSRDGSFSFLPPSEKGGGGSFDHQHRRGGVGGGGDGFAGGDRGSPPSSPPPPPPPGSDDGGARDETRKSPDGPSAGTTGGRRHTPPRHQGSSSPGMTDASSYRSVPLADIEDDALDLFVAPRENDDGRRSPSPSPSPSPPVETIGEAPVVSGSTTGTEDAGAAAAAAGPAVEEELPTAKRRRQQRDRRRPPPPSPPPRDEGAGRRRDRAATGGGRLDARSGVLSALMAAAPPAALAAPLTESEDDDGDLGGGPSSSSYPSLAPPIPPPPAPPPPELFDLALPPGQYEVVLRRRSRRGRGGGTRRRPGSGPGGRRRRRRRRSGDDEGTAEPTTTAAGSSAPDPPQQQERQSSSSSSSSSSQRRRQLFPNHVTSSPVPSEADASSVGSGGGGGSGSGGFRTPPTPTYYPAGKSRGDATQQKQKQQQSPRRDEVVEGGEVRGGGREKPEEEECCHHLDDGDGPPADDPNLGGEDEDEDEDTSLGMKLTIMGGHVIVQDLISLSDGRASPAQLCGSISPGDVLIAIDGSIITGLDVVSLSRALDVLKGGSSNGGSGGRGVSGGSAATTTDDSSSHPAPRQQQPPSTLSRSRSRPELRLRFAAGEGTIVLREERDRVRRRRQRQQQLMIPETDDIFSLSQFVDQLSGMPMFMPPGGDGDGGGDAERPGEVEEEEEKKDASSSASAPQIAVINSDEAATSLPKRPPPELTALPAMEETVVPGKKKKERVVVGGGQVVRRSGDATNNIGIISDYIRRSRRTSALSWYSTFYEAAASEEEEEDDGGGTGRHLLRRDALSLFDDLDGEGGSRVSEGGTFDRSEQSLDIQTSLSTEERLRRGEKVMEVAVNYCLVVESTENHEDLKRAMKGGHKSTPMRRKHRGMNNIGSDTSTCSADEVAISEFDEESDGFDEWKLRLMRLLDAASLSSITDDSGPGAASAAASATASTDHQSLLSPPNLAGGRGRGGAGAGVEGFLFGDDVSKILATKSRALPDARVTNAVFDLALKLQQEDGIFGARAQVSSTSTRISAARQRGAFLLDQALPRWLETFKPLRWEHRRLLWPLSTSSDYSLGGTGHGPASEHGSVADDASMSSMSMLSLSKSPQRNRQGLQSIVEEMELNPETRMHACFLVSFYFSQKLPSMTMREAHKFIKSYGAYLNLTQSLAAAAELFSEDIVDVLLELARYDVRHKRAMKNLASKKSHSVILEQPMLSVLVQCLKVAPLDQNALPLLVSAYPDLKPWQVKKVTALDEGDMASSTYYEYLSSLLDPMYGHAEARQDRGLVREWCILSAKSENPNHRANFKAVASGNSQTFFRDLPMLLDLSVSSGDFDLALSLVDEIVFHPILCEDIHVVKCALDHVRILAHTAVKNEPFDAELLQRACNDMNNFAISDSEVVRRSIDLPKELFEIVQLCGDDERTAKKDFFIDFVASTFPPKEVLETLHLWCPLASSTVAPALCAILSRGAVQGLYSELSGALLRVHRSRGDLTLTESDDTSLPYSELDGAASPGDATKHSGGELWSAILEGAAVVEK